MEIIKDGATREFKWKDVTFHVKATATAGDRYDIDLLYDVDKAGQVLVPRRQLYRTAIERCVVRWDGVTDNGKPVPFSLENLDKLPASGEDVILLLGTFIVNKCGLFESQSESDGKNE